MLDCSISISWCFEEEQNEYTEDVIDSLNNDCAAIVPVIWKLEIVNALRMAYKRKRVAEDRQADLLKFLCELPIHTKSSATDCIDLLNLCKKYNLTSYDASYLDLAIKFNAPIATLDSALQKAAIDAGVGAYLL